MKKICHTLCALLLGVNSVCYSNQTFESYEMVSKVVNDFTQLCGIDRSNNITLLSPNLSTISISFLDQNGFPLLANEFYRDYSTKSKLFIYKYNVKSYPKTIIINGSNVGECK
jgi:hypothetical protein